MYPHLVRLSPIHRTFYFSCLCVISSCHVYVLLLWIGSKHLQNTDLKPNCNTSSVLPKALIPSKHVHFIPGRDEILSRETLLAVSMIDNMPLVVLSSRISIFCLMCFSYLTFALLKSDIFRFSEISRLKKKNIDFH